MLLRRARGPLAADAIALVALKAAVSVWVLHQGFTHVSDDDYARTVIAQQLVHAPRLDPSGTSWLPLPFWLTGAAMAVAGRSLAVARVAAVAFSALAVAAPYAALRIAGAGRTAAVSATAIAMALPWSAWLGAATVPEGWVGALVAAAVLAAPVDAARPGCAGALLAGSLARYETWPACAAFAVCCAVKAHRARGAPCGGGGRVAREIACAAVALSGIAAWLAWNAHAHGDALHFLARVRTFRAAVGAANVPLSAKVLTYPRALAGETPEVMVLGVLGLGAMAARPPLRARWLWAVASAAAILAFLVVGDVRDGAPTHHAARALAPLWWVLTGCGVDAVASAYPRLGPAGRRAVVGASAIAAAAWLALLPGRWKDAPGRTEYERRDAQIARGQDLARRHVAAAEVTPCSFEHFALLAAWGEPERAAVHDRLGTPPTPACPLLVER